MIAIFIIILVVALSILVLTKYKKKTNDTKEISSQKPLPSIPEIGIEIKLFNFHKDIKDLLWFADSILKNIDPNDFYNTSYFEGIKIKITFTGMQEPSMIYTKLPISVPASFVEPPSYYPTYESLSPEQKYIYLKFLENPYDERVNISYVFILYYGLERHLLGEKWEQSAEVIIKLRHIHKNKSFQTYSADALILLSVFKKKPEIAVKVIQSLETDYEKEHFPCYLFLLCAYFFNVPIYARNIMLYADWFKFSNKNYIRKVPELFEQTLEQKLISITGNNFILLKSILSESELNNLAPHKVKIFANTSLSDTKVTVPFIFESISVADFMFSLLSETHNSVKQILAEQRKQNNKS